jgi:hypothetical protein
MTSSFAILERPDIFRKKTDRSPRLSLVASRVKLVLMSDLFKKARGVMDTAAEVCFECVLMELRCGQTFCRLAAQTRAPQERRSANLMARRYLGLAQVHAARLQFTDSQAEQFEQERLRLKRAIYAPVSIRKATSLGVDK